MDEFTALAWQTVVLTLGVMVFLGAEVWTYWFWLAVGVAIEARHIRRNG